jgi:alkylation response protein AidB-like acyl-CoA dehydrogenase
MSAYKAPLDDIRFLLEEVLDFEETVTALPGLGDAELAVVMHVLDEAGTFCEDVLLPLNASGDAEGCTFADGDVTTPEGFPAAYHKLSEGGWTGLSAAQEHGGAGLPHTVRSAFEEMLCATNLSFATYTLLGHGAYAALERHGSDAQRATFLPKLASGEWAGTMCLTEAHAGTDLGMIRTRAEPDGDGGYRISGQKIFITAGEHDMTENIVHLVLAKLPDAPEGTRGISMFIVPKVRADGTRNGVHCRSIEHKMGIRGSSTCVLEFDGAHGELVGEPHRGMRYMFTMMNGARLGVGIQGLGLADAAYQRAAHYARERVQGRSLAGAAAPDAPADPIIVHPDVRAQLLRVRSQVQAARALALWVAMEIDVAAHHADVHVREAAGELVALMTPIVKAGLTDLAFEGTSLALGVFGGHGYITDTGIEQYVRDARITQIYEGTNGVQALDLVGRKLGENYGRNLRRFFHPVDAWLTEHAADAALADFVEPTVRALGRLQRATAWLGEKALADREEAGAAASDYLRLFTLTSFAYLWCRMAAAATHGTGAATPEFRAAKLATGRFFMARVLPETSALERKVTAGKRTLMELEAAAF